jgi:hypothetical protein
MRATGGGRDSAPQENRLSVSYDKLNSSANQVGGEKFAPTALKKSNFAISEAPKRLDLV